MRSTLYSSSLNFFYVGMMMNIMFIDKFIGEFNTSSVIPLLHLGEHVFSFFFGCGRGIGTYFVGALLTITSQIELTIWFKIVEDKQKSHSSNQSLSPKPSPSFQSFEPPFSFNLVMFNIHQFSTLSLIYILKYANFPSNQMKQRVQTVDASDLYDAMFSNHFIQFNNFISSRSDYSWGFESLDTSTT